MNEKLLIRAIDALETIGEHLSEIDKGIDVLGMRLEDIETGLYKGFTHLAEKIERLG